VVVTKRISKVKKKLMKKVCKILRKSITIYLR